MQIQIKIKIKIDSYFHIINNITYNSPNFES